MNDLKEKETECSQQEGADREDASASSAAEPVKKRSGWFGRGIYTSKDVPIQLLDKCIAGSIILVIGMIIYFAVNGGFMISFDSRGGSEIAPQKLRYGKLIERPEDPRKQGYEFAGWYYENDGEKDWNFMANQVTGDLTLIARWEPAAITVKLDPAGGSLPEEQMSLQVMYQGVYGELPVPEKEGAVFAGWIYSGEIITEESEVWMPGEHVLTASWN